MKFAWLFILSTTISSSINATTNDEDENTNALSRHTSLIENENVKKNSSDRNIQENFFDHLFNYTEQTINTSIMFTPHALRFILGVSCLYTKNQDLTYMLMRASGVAWILYHFKIGTGDHSAHENDTPLMQSIYLKSFIYSGLAYITTVPYFTHLGALHITHGAFSYWHTLFTIPKKSK